MDKVLKISSVIECYTGGNLTNKKDNDKLNALAKHSKFKLLLDRLLLDIKHKEYKYKM